MIIREAAPGDLPGIVALLADDEFGGARERPALPLDPAYGAAFAAMRAQAGNLQFVGEVDGELAACAQLTMVPGLSRLGVTRATIEGVRVARARRGQGLGEVLIRHCIEVSRAHGAGLVQLTSGTARLRAHRFYERLGFTTTSVGMKLSLD